MFWVSTRTLSRPRSPSLSSARTGADPHARTEANIASTARTVFVPRLASQPNRGNSPIVFLSVSRALICHLHMLNPPIASTVSSNHRHRPAAGRPPRAATRCRAAEQRDELAAPHGSPLVGGGPEHSSRDLAAVIPAASRQATRKARAP